MRNLIYPLLLGLVLSCQPEAEVEQTPTTSPDRSDLPATNSPFKLATETVTLEDVEQPIRLTGRVIPLQEATISSQVPGLILSTNKILQEGKYYQKGETVIAIDDEPLQFRLRAERSQLVTNLVRLLSDMSIDYPEQHPNWEQFTDDIEAASLLPDLPEINNRQFKYFISAAGIPAQFYAIKAQEATLDDYLVRAPFSGQLTLAAIEPGAVVQPGQVLAKISRTDVYELEVSLPVSLVEQLRVGQSVSFRSRNLDQDYVGKVHRFGPRIDPATQSVTAFVRLSGPELRSGLYLEAEIPGERLEQVAVLPKEALNRDGTVYVISEGVVTAKEVDVLLLESDKVYLNGIATGDVVVVESSDEPLVGRSVQ